MNKNKSTILGLLLTFLLIMTACALPGNLLGGADQTGDDPDGGQVTSPPVDDPVGSGPIPDLSGSWGGLLSETNGIQRSMDLVIFHSEGASEFSGTVSFTSQDGSFVEGYDITGTFDGTTVRFIAPGGTETRHFWATVSAGVMSGQAAFNCFDCPDLAWGSFSLTYGVLPGGVQIGEPPMLPSDFDITGTWTGTLFQHDSPDTPLDMLLEVVAESGTNQFYGQLTITLPASEYQEFYLVSGEVLNGITFTFHDSGTEVITHYFWGNILGPGSIEGWGSLVCSECFDQTYALFSLGR